MRPEVQVSIPSSRGKFLNVIVAGLIARKKESLNPLKSGQIPERKP